MPTVDGVGVITAIDAGTAQAQATIGGTTGAFTIVVVEDPSGAGARVRRRRQ